MAHQFDPYRPGGDSSSPPPIIPTPRYEPPPAMPLPPSVSTSREWNTPLPYSDYSGAPSGGSSASGEGGCLILAVLFWPVVIVVYVIPVLKYMPITGPIITNYCETVTKAQLVADMRWFATWEVAVAWSFMLLMGLFPQWLWIPAMFMLVLNLGFWTVLAAIFAASGYLPAIECTSIWSFVRTFGPYLLIMLVGWRFHVFYRNGWILCENDEYIPWWTRIVAAWTYRRHYDEVDPWWRKVIRVMRVIHPFNRLNAWYREH